MCDMFGGPSAGEQNALNQQTGLGQAMSAAFGQQYGQQQNVLNQLNSQIYRIQTGQTGPGMSGAEYNLRQAGIINNAAAQARNAIQASDARSVGAQVVSPTGMHGDESGLTRQSGIRQQVAGEAGAIAGAQEAAGLNALAGENYTLGRQQAAAGASGLQALAGDYNPLQYAGAAETAINNKFTQAQQIQKEKQERSSAIFGAITGAGLDALTFGMGAAGGGGLMGGLNSLLGMGGGGGGGSMPTGGTQAMQNQALQSFNAANPSSVGQQINFGDYGIDEGGF
jgi:hypothetical protein